MAARQRKDFSHKRTTGKEEHNENRERERETLNHCGGERPDSRSGLQTLGHEQGLLQSCQGKPGEEKIFTQTFPLLHNHEKMSSITR